MDLYNTFSILIVLSAVFAFINYKFLKLPSTIGLMIIALIVSIVLVIIGRFFPFVFQNATSFLSKVDFSQILMGAMLNFLLFAGAIQVKIKELREQRLSVILFSTVSVILSTFLIGGVLYLLLPLFHLQVPLIECLLFGALISPTDPIAVLSIVKEARMPLSLETKIAGESLFNDGVAVVVFITILNMAQRGETSFHLLPTIILFAREAGGGFLMGMLLGYLGLLALKQIDNYKVEVMITIAIVMGGYSLANVLHVSGPLAMVVAGIITGNYTSTYAMSPVTRDYLYKFWEMVDEILNAILFVLIGFEILLIQDMRNYLWVGLLSIGIVLGARYLSVWFPSQIIRFRQKIDQQTIRILVWGGLRGGISVALALSLEKSMHRDLFVSVTYLIVIFSIIVQGLTIRRLLKTE
jgi:Na+:H+ antiporter